MIDYLLSTSLAKLDELIF